ncbi:MAG: magnesium protoporphyrin IX methyltransferase [Rhodobacteraceae bacterium]|nr:MAG: magnesium protoporphyrin IX methyltransferase [Paracoccaceae bacterium]
MTKPYSETRDRVQVYFDQTAVKAWEALTNETPVSAIRSKVRAGRQEMRNLLLSRLPNDLTGHSILDAGCGTGQMSIDLGMRGASVLGIDISENLINIAKERLPNKLKSRVNFAVSDMIKDHGNFDHVVLMDSLIHYPEADAMAVLSNLMRRTRNGILFTLVPTNSVLKFKLLVGRLFPRSDRSPVIVPLNIKSFIKMFDSRFKGKESFEMTSVGQVNKWFYTSEAIELKR